MVGTRTAGGSSVQNLFGLDDLPSTPRSNKVKQQKGSKANQLLVVAQDGGSKKKSKMQKVTETAAPAGMQPVAAAPVSAVSAPQNVQVKLTKSQWLRVERFRAVGVWGNDPDVVTFKVQRPGLIDGYYFHLYWDNPYGRNGREPSQWSVADLNKMLLAGKLTFQLHGGLDGPYLERWPANM